VSPRRSRDSASLLDALLEYARDAMGADHAVFSEWLRETDAFTNAAVTGILTAPEVAQVDEPLSASGFFVSPAERVAMRRRRPTLYARRDRRTPALMRAYLERIGAELELLVPVRRARQRGLFLELYYCGPGAALTPEQVATADRLAPMLAAALSRDELAEDNARLVRDLRRAESARRRSEERFQRLIDQLPVAVYETDGDGNMTFFSPGEELLGFSRAAWRRDPERLWEDSLHPEDRDWVMAAFAEAVVQHRPYEARFRMVSRDGRRTVWVREYERVTYDRQGRAKSRQGVGIDITAEVLAEQARLEAEQRYRTLIEQLPAATFTDRADGTSVYVSPQIEQVTGMKPDEWAAGWDGWLKRIHPDDREWVNRDVHQQLERGGFAVREYRMLLDDGSLRWVHSRSTVLTGPDGDRTFQGVLFDITAQREAELALESSERRLRALVEQMPATTYVHDIRGRSQFISPQAEQLFGYPMTRWSEVTEFWKTVVHPEDLPGVEAEYGEALARGRPYDQEYRIVRADGEVRWIHDTSVVLPGSNGVPGLVQGILTDVTDRRLAEQLLREGEQHRNAVLAAMVTAEEQERHRIAGELHDDSIQVMTAALVDLDRLRRAAAAGDNARVLEAAHHARDTLAAATERTRLLSFELRPPMLEMHGLSRAIRALADETSREAGFEVGVRSRLRRYSQTTETLVYRAIRECLVNARRHSGAGSVQITAVERRGVIECQVADDGTGFDPGRALAPDRLRLHVGLDTIGERLRLAGGALDLESSPGNGTRVRITVPAQPRGPEGADGPGPPPVQ
jgi:PAS domain S-box-containing protein